MTVQFKRLLQTVRAVCTAVAVCGLCAGYLTFRQRDDSEQVLATRLQLAESAFQDRKYQLADQYYRQILSTNPGEIGPQERLARGLEYEHHYVDELSLYKQILNDHTSASPSGCENAYLHENYGRALVENGDLKDGKAQIKFAALESRLDPACGDLRSEAASLLAGHPAADPDTYVKYVDLGHAMLAKRNYKAAYSAFKKATQFAPDPWLAYVMMAAMQESRKDYPAALSLYRTAATYHSTIYGISPNPIILFGLGRIELELGDRKDARAYLARSISLSKRDPRLASNEADSETLFKTMGP